MDVCCVDTGDATAAILWFSLGRACANIVLNRTCFGLFSIPVDNKWLSKR
jgi:hypothetical protein